MNSRAVAGAQIDAVVTVAAGTQWERRFDLGTVASTWQVSTRHRRAVEREMAAYREQIAREGYRPQIGGGEDG